MPSLSVTPPFPVLNDTDGTPLESGFVYIGTANLNPETNPVAIFWDAAATIPAAQPLRTAGGYIVRNGTPANVYVSTSDYSITIRDKNKGIVLSALSSSGTGWSAYIQSAVLSTLAASNGSSLIGFIQAGTGAVTRTAQDKEREVLSVNDFGAVGDGITNDTAAINLALSAGLLARKPVFFPSPSYAVDEATPGCGYALLNNGVSMIGKGALNTVILPRSTMPNTADFIRIQPTGGSVLDFVEVVGLMVYPASSGTKRGKRSIFVDMTAVSNATAFHIDGCYFSPGNDYSLEWATDATNNPQGGPANSLFERSMFWEGIKLTNSGDSITFRNCVFRSSIGSGRPGVNNTGIFAAGGQPSQLTIEQCNFDCDGGAVLALNGLKLTLINNNIEQSHGTGTGSSACIDLDGTGGGIAWAVFRGNSIGAFGTAALSSLVRINNAYQTEFAHNRLSSSAAGVCPTAVLITASANETIVAANEIGTNFTTTINDLGVGTRGVPKAVAPSNGFANVGSGYQPLETYKSPYDGMVTLRGFLSCPASPNGVVLGTIPVGFRPAYAHRFPIFALVGGGAAMASVDISTAGLVTYFGGVATQIALGTLSFGGLGFLSGNL